MMTRNAATILVSLALVIPLGIVFAARVRQRRFGANASPWDRVVWWTGMAALVGMATAVVFAFIERPPQLGFFAMSLWGGVFFGVPMFAFQAFGVWTNGLVKRIGGPWWVGPVVSFVSAAPAIYVGMAVLQELLWLTSGLHAGFKPHRMPFFNFHRGNHSFALMVAFGAGTARLAADLRGQIMMREMEKLRAESTRARLTHLEARLRPHFLYNALSGLAGLIHEHPDRAEAMTLALARLLQRSLDGADEAPTLPLRTELDLVRAYLDVEQHRFGDRLRVSFDVDEATLDTELPRLTLQPLVENAIKHGLARSDAPVHVVVAATRAGRRLHLAVADDGPPFPPDLNGGHGLTSVTERLALVYGDDFAVRFVNAREDGRPKRVELELPLAPARLAGHTAHVSAA